MTCPWPRKTLYILACCVLLTLAAIALLQTAFVQRLVAPVPLQPIDQALAEINSTNDRERAPEFRYRYPELVRCLTRANFSRVAWILMYHGREYSLAHIEPLLQNETGDSRLLVAVYLYTCSAGLHPDARDVLLAADQKDEFVEDALRNDRPLRGQLRERIRRKCGLDEYGWEQMTDAEKWRAWRGRFSETFGDTSMN